MTPNERSIEDRVLILETRYEERDRQLQSALDDIRAELAKIATGGMAICATHAQTIDSSRLRCDALESRLDALRRDSSESVRRVWVQLWTFATIVLGGVAGAVIAHLTGKL